MTPARPISRFVRIFAVLTVLATVLLLTLGALTSSFRAGMADPIWPTEPWFLLVNGHRYNLEENRGFLLEHTHRAAGFTVGALVSLLALAAWISGPRKLERSYGLIAIVLLLVFYGTFHREMHVASDARATRQIALREGRTDVPPPEIFPEISGVLTAVSAFALVGCCVLHTFGNQPGKWVRALSGILLVCVMLQGLLGGYRVYLDQLVGPELTQIHGIFAQCVFAAMCCLPSLATYPKAENVLSESNRRRFTLLSLALPTVVILQLIWGVMVRHTGEAFAQRLHLLTAFGAFGIGIWLAIWVLSNPVSRRQLGFAVWHLLLMFAVQVALGVEAYLGKFAALGTQAEVAPMARKITEYSAAIRSLHVLIGTAILASSVVMALRVFRRIPNVEVEQPMNHFSSVESDTLFLVSEVAHR